MSKVNVYTEFNLMRINNSIGAYIYIHYIQHLPFAALDPKDNDILASETIISPFKFVFPQFISCLFSVFTQQIGLLPINGSSQLNW